MRRFQNVDWHFLLLLLSALSLLLFISFFSHSPTTTTTTSATSSDTTFNETDINLEFDKPKIAICLVGGARRFELTGPSIIQNVLKVYPNADLFLHSPLDSDAYKFSILKVVHKIAVIKLFNPEQIKETDLHQKVLLAHGSPHGIQGLLQYFKLVEGCLSMIDYYQKWNNFTYDWVIRTRVDGYWSAPLDPDIFIPGHYLVPSGSSYNGLNDRFGVGDFNLSKVALSRFSLLPKLYLSGLRRLNSEGAFKAQLTTSGVQSITKRLPFCVMSDRTYVFPPGKWIEPVASISSLGPLSGTKCRPCNNHICKGDCMKKAMNETIHDWGWTDWEDGKLELCDARGKFEEGWEEEFDRVAGKEFAAARKNVSEMKLKECISDFEEMKKRAYVWDAPSPIEICSSRWSSA